MTQPPAAKRVRTADYPEDAGDADTATMEGLATRFGSSVEALTLRGTEAAMDGRAMSGSLTSANILSGLAQRACVEGKRGKPGSWESSV